jgi:hypothetical protein
VPDIKLVIGIPTTGTVAMGFAYSLCGLTSYIAARGIVTRPETSVTMSLDVVESSVIHTNREQIVRRAIDKEATHLLFLDHDMVFEPTILDVLAGRRQSVVVTNYCLKQPDTDFVAVDLHGNRVPTVKESTGLLPISYSGFGVSLFDLAAIKDVPQPWFMPEFDAATSSYTTEDNPFFRRVREAGITVYLDHDASKLISGHVGHKAYRWQEWAPKAPAPEPKPELSVVPKVA